jgi:hypothetical protein
MSESDRVATVARVTTRRAMLAAAAGGAAAIAARAAMPVRTLAADPNDLVLNQDNPTTTDTGVTNATPNGNAFHGHAAGTGSGIVGSGADGPGARAASNTVAAVFAVSGDGTDAAPLADTLSTGIYGYTPGHDPNVAAAGVWGDSGDHGVVGTGGGGVAGYGNYGVEGHGFGTGGVGVYGVGETAGNIGVYAYAKEADGTALKVVGKATFSRSGRTYFSAGRSTKEIFVRGVNSSSLVFAVLSTNRSGRWVRAVVPVTGRFVIYLNLAVTAPTNVVWWVLN